MHPCCKASCFANIDGEAVQVYSADLCAADRGGTKITLITVDRVIHVFDTDLGDRIILQG